MIERTCAVRNSEVFRVRGSIFADTKICVILWIIYTTRVGWTGNSRAIILICQ